MRHELKYLLNPIQYTMLSRLIQNVLPRDEHAGETGDYFIRSIYFDSPERTAWRAKEDGIHRRKKYRIRFYNGNPERCMLECKEKFGTRIQKTSCGISPAQAQALLEGGKHLELSEGDDELLLRVKSKILSEGFEPVVTVDYVREAYVSLLSDLRITFDKEIAWGGVDGCLKAERYLSYVCGEDTVLEVKYNEYLPEHISRLIASVSPVQTAASKYVACVSAQAERERLFTL